MYVVQCPKCQQKMKVKQELHQVKVRCAHCKKVFLAETEEMTDSPAVGATPAPAASRPAVPAPKPKAANPKAPKPQAEEPIGIDLGSATSPSSAPAPSAPGAPKVGSRVLRKKSIAPMIVVIGAGVLCIAFAAIFIWQVERNKNRRDIAVKQPDGSEKLMSKAEYADWLKQQDDARTALPMPANTAVASAENMGSHNPNPGHPSTRPGAGATSTSSPSSAIDMPPGETADNITTDNAEAMSELGDMPDKYKDKVQLTRPKIYPNELEPKTGNIVGEVQNLSDSKTLKIVTLTFEIINKDRVVGGTGEIKVEYIPPSAVMRYSVEYHLDAVGRGLRPVVSKVEYAPDDTVSWMVAEGLQYEKAGDGVKVSGRVKNETGSIVRDVKVYATFFNKHNEFVGTSEPVKLMDDKTSLVKESSGRFIVRFDTRNKTIEEITSADIRVVGKKG